MADYSKKRERYRLDFVKENTFARLWSVRMTSVKVIIVSTAVIAGFAALLWLVMAYTPIRHLLPESLSGDMRNRYLETALRLDSLEQAARINDAYIANIVAIMRDDLPGDSVLQLAAAQVIASDSLLLASESERQFVREYEEEERFNLSVLSPIAAEGMIFGAPATSVIKTESLPTQGLKITTARNIPVQAVYRGSVVDINTGSSGLSTVIVQHPNDFISIYSGISDVYVAKGRKVSAAQSLGNTAGDSFTFELWHNGTALDPQDYIGFE